MIEQIISIIDGLNKRQRTIFIVGFALLVSFLVFLIVYSAIEKDNAALRYIVASGLTQEQVQEAGVQLEEAGIKFLIIGTGNSLTLKTSRDNVNIAKIKLLTSISTGKHTGWEIFDKSSLGSTSFENNVKYLRAIEGELSRTLESLPFIAKANVKIALPKDSIFVKTKTPPSASVVLHLRANVALSRKQIVGIKSFLATAIPDLTPKRISLIAQDGTLIDEEDGEVNGKKFLVHSSYRKKIEKEYEEKIMALLVPFLGTNRVIAKVSVVLDFINRAATKELYEPDGTIRSSQTKESQINDEVRNTNEAIVPGTQSNIQPPVSGSSITPASKSTKADRENTVNYEISKTIINEVDRGYSKIAQISAAVTYDSTVLDTIEDKELFNLNMISTVKEAIGFNEERGDKVSVRAFKFIHIEDMQKVSLLDDGEFSYLTFLKAFLDEFGAYLKYLFIALILIFFYNRFVSNKSLEQLADEGFGIDVKSDGSGGFGANNKASPLDAFEEHDTQVEDDKLRQKIRQQILDNIRDIDESDYIKYEVLIEELTKKVEENPEGIAQLIDMLIDDEQLVKSKKR